MEPVSETPTEPTDYAALSAVYGALLGALAATARGRDPIGRAEIVPLSAATFALSKLVVHEKVETWLRAPFVEERPDGRRPRGRRLRNDVLHSAFSLLCAKANSAHEREEQLGEELRELRATRQAAA